MIARRTLLTGAALGLLAGCVRDMPAVPGVADGPGGCRTPGELVGFDRVGTGTLVYEPTGAATSMRADPGFLTQLDAWADEWVGLSGLGPITTVRSFGAYVDKCHSYHQIGKAFDFAGVVHTGGEVSLRYDRWAPGSGAQLRDYWRLAASLHLHFGYTLAHPYDAAHHNHIHVDTVVSGDALSRFNPRSGTQVQLVQHACRHVFGHDVAHTGEYDEQTKAAVRRVQTGAGLTVPLREPDGWHGFLRAVARG